MSPILQKILGSAIRFLLGAAVGWLITSGALKDGDVSPGQIENLVGLLVTVVTGVWIAQKNKKEIVTQHVALAATKPGATMDDVNAAVSAGVTVPVADPAVPPVLQVPATPEAKDAKKQIIGPKEPPHAA